jgi:hypothetical protein
MEEDMVHANMRARKKKYSVQLAKHKKETKKAIVISNFLSHMFYFLEQCVN